MIDMKYNRIQEIENYIKNAKVASLDELLNHLVFQYKHSVEI